jgi:murein DD-endopeptidase MepM/ murein hydrolase activator NlpD
MVRVRADGAHQVLAAVGDDAAPLNSAGDGNWAGLLGVDVETPPGEHLVHITVIDGSGASSPSTMGLQVRDGLHGDETIHLDEEAGRLLDPEVRDAEMAIMREIWSAHTPERHWQGMWTPPVTGTVLVSSPFGTSRSYEGLDVVSRHSGMDFRGHEGRTVLAPAAGRVAFAAPLEVRGNTVWIDHGWGVYSGYFHLSEILAEPESMVEPGDVLGSIGRTGRTTGPHLHWEVRVAGVAVQPLQWLIRDVGAVP